MTALREAAIKALEAMDYLHRTGDTQVFDLCHRETTEALRAALAEPAVQEPVAYSVGRTLHWHKGKGVNDAQLYLAPPRRKPLTEEEIYSLFRTVASPVMFARAIERAHGITP